VSLNFIAYVGQSNSKDSNVSKYMTEVMYTVGCIIVWISTY